MEQPARVFGATWADMGEHGRHGGGSPLPITLLWRHRNTIRTHAHGVRLSRALRWLLSLDAPNAHWPAASLVLAPSLYLRSRSR